MVYRSHQWQARGAGLNLAVAYPLDLSAALTPAGYRQSDGPFMFHATGVRERRRTPLKSRRSDHAGRSGGGEKPKMVDARTSDHTDIEGVFISSYEVARVQTMIAACCVNLGRLQTMEPRTSDIPKRCIPERQTGAVSDDSILLGREEVDEFRTACRTNKACYRARTGRSRPVRRACIAVPQGVPSGL